MGGLLELTSKRIRTLVDCELPESDGSALVESKVNGHLASGGTTDVKRQWEVVFITDSATDRTGLNRNGNAREVLRVCATMEMGD